MKVGTSAVALIALTVAGAVPLGPVPPLGGFLDPYRGVWSLATVADLPDSATAAVPGMVGGARVSYDDRGVPHIFASTLEDATRTLGYVVARDRLFQLEIQTRATAGRLTEWVGGDALGIDRDQRRLGLAWAAERDYARLDPASDVGRLVEAYADGVNAWIDGMGDRDLPVEYRLLGTRPFRWEPEYSLYLLKRMGWTLAYQNVERRRRAAEALVGPEAADALFPVNAPIQEPIQTNGRDEPRYDPVLLPPPGAPDATAGLVTRLARSALGDPAGLGSVPWPWAAGAPCRLEPCTGGEDALGSNNWAAGPTKTASGHAILAGDPHLELTLPSIWYEVHLVVPGEIDVYGVTIPGMIGVVIGFNRDVAWSFTNTGADVMDFYRERLDDEARPARYMVDGSWRPLDRRVEVFSDRSGGVIATDTIYHTHRGPVLRDDGENLSLRWTILEGTREYEALLGSVRATTVDEWLAGMTPYHAPAQNGIVADRNGSIAIRSHGSYPIRPGDGRGDVVRDGTSGESDWLGYWPVSRYPYSIDPRQGYLASANQQPIDPQADGGYLGADWPSPWRAIRINTLLREGADLEPDDLRRFQTDPGSARADFFAPRFLAAAEARATAGAGDEALAEAARLLGEWDRRYTKDNTRAVLFELAMSELEERTWDELAETSGRRVATPGSAVLAALVFDSASAWWDDRGTAERETRDQILAESLRAALERARDEFGAEDGEGWRWDRIRHANVYHLLRLPSLSALELPVQGGPSTLSPSSGRGTDGASWRMVVELGDEVAAWVTYPGGQSANPASARYDDRIADWTEGRLAPVLFPRTAEELPPDRVRSTLIVEGR